MEERRIAEDAARRMNEDKTSESGSSVSKTDAWKPKAIVAGGLGDDGVYRRSTAQPGADGVYRRSASAISEDASASRADEEVWRRAAPAQSQEHPGLGLGAGPAPVSKADGGGVWRRQAPPVSKTPGPMSSQPTASTTVATEDKWRKTETSNSDTQQRPNSTADSRGIKPGKYVPPSSKRQQQSGKW